MPACSTCRARWPENYGTCPMDGTVLEAEVEANGDEPTVQKLTTPKPVTPKPTTPMRGSNQALERSLQPSYPDELEPGSFAGEYQIEKKIGEGGMSTVYGAVHPLIGKRAAIKVISRESSGNPDAIERFVREAQAVNKIGHPNIVDVFAFGTLPDGRPYFAMEWLQGKSLRDRMDDELPFQEAIAIMDEIAKALMAAHDAGVVHRDLKPDNVFLADVQEDRPKVILLDFGVAKLTQRTEGMVDATRTGVVVGTPLYISPEQARGASVTEATDIYSLGAIGYEMLTGTVPFMSTSPVLVMAAHMTQPPETPSRRAKDRNLPRHVDSVLLGMLAKDPARRPSLEKVRLQLSQLKGLVVEPLPEGRRARAGGPSGGSLVRIAAIVALVGGGAAAAVLLGRSDDRNRDHQPVAVVTPDAAVLVDAPAREPTVPRDAELAGATPETPVTPIDAAEVVAVIPIDADEVVAVPVDAAERSTPSVAVVPPPDARPAPGPDAAKAPVVERPDPPLAPKQGRLVIELTGVAGATITVDGKVAARGAKRATVSLKPGAHAVRVEAAGHKPYEMNIVLEPGERMVLRPALPKVNVNAVHSPFPKKESK